MAKEKKVKAVVKRDPSEDNISLNGKLFFDQDVDEIDFPSGKNDKKNNNQGKNVSKNNGEEEDIDDDEVDFVENKENQKNANRKNKVRNSSRSGSNTAADDDDNNDNDNPEEEEDDDDDDEDKEEDFDDEKDDDDESRDDKNVVSYNINGDREGSQSEEDEDINVPFKNIFRGYNNESFQADAIKLKKEDYDYFLKNDIEHIANSIKNMNTATRLKLVDHLNEKDINILQITKESSPNFRIIYFGLFSPWHIFHALVLKCCFLSKNINDLLCILLLKDRATLEDIKQSYIDIYHKTLEEEIDSGFGSNSIYLKALINSSNYDQSIISENYVTEASKTFKLIHSGDYEKILTFFIGLKPKCFKELASTFYKKYGFTISQYLNHQIDDLNLYTIFKNLQISLVSPVAFYCKVINDCYKSTVYNYMLPYIILYLDANGLKTIAEKYRNYYGKIDIKSMEVRYEENVGVFLVNCLNKYFA